MVCMSNFIKFIGKCHMKINDTVYLWCDKKESQPNINRKAKSVSRSIHVEPKSSLVLLPSTLWGKIFSYLTFKDICNFRISLQNENDLFEYNSKIFCDVWSLKISSKNLAPLVDVGRKKSNKDICDLVSRFSTENNLGKKKILTKRSLPYFPLSLYCIVNQLIDNCRTLNLKEELTINHKQNNSRVEFTNGGNHLMINDIYGSAQFYNRTSDTTWEKGVVVDPHDSLMARSFLNFATNNMLVASVCYGFVKIYRRDPDSTWTHNTTLLIKVFPLISPLFSFDDNHLCIIDSDHKLHLYSKKQLNECEYWVKQLVPLSNVNVNPDAAQGEKISSILFSDDSKCLMIISCNNIAKIYSIDPVTMMWSEDITMPSTKLATFSSDSSQVITACIENENEETVNIYKKDRGGMWVKEHSFGLEPLAVEKTRSVISVRFNRADDNQIVINSERSSFEVFLQIYSMGSSGLWMNEFSIDMSLGLFNVSDDGNHVVVAKYRDNTINIYSKYVNDNWREVTMPSRCQAKSVRFSPDSSTMVIINDNYIAKIYGMDREYNWICKASIGIPASNWPLICFSPDSSKLVINAALTSKVFSLYAGESLNDAPPPTKKRRSFNWFKSCYNYFSERIVMLCEWIKNICFKLGWYRS